MEYRNTEDIARKTEKYRNTDEVAREAEKDRKTKVPRKWRITEIEEIARKTDKIQKY